MQDMSSSVVVVWGRRLNVVVEYTSHLEGGVFKNDHTSCGWTFPFLQGISHGPVVDGPYFEGGLKWGYNGFIRMQNWGLILGGHKIYSAFPVN